MGNRNVHLRTPEALNRETNSNPSPITQAKVSAAERAVKQDHLPQKVRQEAWWSVESESFSARIQSTGVLSPGEARELSQAAYRDI